MSTVTFAVLFLVIGVSEFLAQKPYSVSAPYDGRFSTQVSFSSSNFQADRLKALNSFKWKTELSCTSKSVIYQHYLSYQAANKSRVFASKLSLGEQKWLDHNITSLIRDYHPDETHMDLEFRLMQMTVLYIQQTHHHLIPGQEEYIFGSLMYDHPREGPSWVRVQHLAEYVRDIHFVGYPEVDFIHKFVRNFMRPATLVKTAPVMWIRRQRISMRKLGKDFPDYRAIILVDIYQIQECIRHDWKISVTFINKWAKRVSFNSDLLRKLDLYERWLVRKEWNRENQGRRFNGTLFPDFKNLGSVKPTGLPPCCHYGADRRHAEIYCPNL